MAWEAKAWSQKWPDWELKLSSKVGGWIKSWAIWVHWNADWNCFIYTLYFFFFELLTSLLCALWPFLVFFGVGKNESGHMGHWLARSGQVPLAWERQTAVLTGKVGVGWSQEEAYERERTVVSCPPLALLPRRVITHLLGTRQGLSFVFSSIRWCALLPFCIQTAEQRGHTYIFIFIVFLHAHSSEKT